MAIGIAFLSPIIFFHQPDVTKLKSNSVDFSHPDLRTKIIGGYDYANNDYIPEDEDGHGTHVAGIAAASTHNGEGVAGVSWHSPIVPFRVFDAARNASSEWIADAIIHAAGDNEVWVINLSLGDYEDAIDSYLVAAVNHAYQKGITVVASAGNDNTDRPHYPSAYRHVISVAATNAEDKKASFSNYGASISLAAPGDDILSTSNAWYKYGSLNGTSMAAPFVSGVAALVYSALPSGLRTHDSRTADRVRMILEATAEDLGESGWDPIFGWGRIDAYRAVFEASHPPRLDFRALLYVYGREHNSSTLITVRIRESGTNQLLYEGQVTTDSEGRYDGLELYGIPSGNYDVIVKSPASISKRVSNVHFVADSNTFVDFTDGDWHTYLVGGDFNNDDKINTLDYSSYNMSMWERC